MPELPEVQALATDLSQRLVGRTVARLEITSFVALKTVEPPVEALRGQVVTGVERHGKLLDVVAQDVRLVVHLGLGGWVRWHDGTTPPRPVRPGTGPLVARLVLDDGPWLDVTEAGTHKIAALYVVRQAEDVPAVARLGPDPLDDDFTRTTLRGILDASGRSRVKGVLRDQAKIAGIGNAYSDEILHTAQLSPFTPSSSVDDGELARLFDAIQGVLRGAAERAAGLGAADLKREKKVGLRVHGRAGQACPVCGDTIRQVVYSSSSTEYCPTCQTGGVPLADRRTSRLLK